MPGAPQPTGPEWSALRARAALQREGVRGHSFAQQYVLVWSGDLLFANSRLIISFEIRQRQGSELGVDRLGGAVL